ncbi:amino acid adenylation domain-containing protein [Actinokineospora iranica]|nr:amino acid adenylation domain-containing protein [Actinokineospora iranica]
MRDVVDMFDKCAEQFPDRPALIHGDNVTSYARLAEAVRATAAMLGPDPGVVGVLTARRPEVVVALLGVLAAGGTYCPIDPAYPLARQQALVTVAGCQVVIAAAPGAAAPPGARVVDLPSGPAPDRVEFPARKGDAAAYVLFTSGSSGAPKPVLVPHRAIATVVRGLGELFGITPDDRVLQFAALNWDTCLEEILPALTRGAALVFDDDAYSGSLPRLLRVVESQGITVLDLPTAFWHELVDHLHTGEHTVPGSVRLTIIGGEAAGPVRLTQWRGRGTDRIRLVNTYGCTETTLITHAVDLHGPLAPGPGAWWGEGKAPIGHALPHVRARIDAAGQLLVGGPGLASGYLGMPEVTSAKFVADDTGEIYFHTGDRVSVRPDGMVVHEGRIDHEFKVRGIRVDPAEIEAHILEHPEVASAAVVGAGATERIVMTAYVVSRSATRPDLAADIRSRLRLRVPGHLVPHHVKVVPELMRTATGKVDRSATHAKYQQKPFERTSES